jgi:hypothetical protein
MTAWSTRPRGEELEAALSRAYEIEGEAACDLLSVEVTTFAGAIDLLKYARDYDDATFGKGWPTELVGDEVKHSRTWHYFLIAKLADVLPELVPVSS